MKPSIPPSRRLPAAFTLIEMLIVVSVIGMLLALSAPRVFSLLRSNELTTQGENLRNWLSQAQQQALTSNADVEVRFYKFADLNSGQLEAEFRAAVFFQHDRFGELQPLSQIYRIRDPLALSDNPELSNILDRSENRSTQSETSLQQELQDLIGDSVEGDNIESVSFRFRPDGSTDLDKSTKAWFMTLVEEGRTGSSGKEATDVPKNFVCLQIDAYNGSIREYRP